MTDRSTRLVPCVLGLALGAAALLGSSVHAQNGPSWPQWRGPDRDGISKESDWSLEGKRELWFTNVGLGYATVSIHDGRLFTSGHDTEAREDTVFCLDPDTGKEIWSHSFPASRMSMGHGGGTLTTPSVGGDRVYVSHREGKFFCFDAATGKQHWAKDLKKAHNLRSPRWGFAASPLILDEMIVMNSGHVLAFDPDGEIIWKTERNYRDSYSTPATMTVADKRCLVVFNGTGLVLLERSSGKELAVYEWKTRNDVNAATPVVVGDKIFISSGYNHGCAMVQASVNKLELVWESKVMRTQMSGCVHWEGHLYGFDESTLKCLGMDGSVKWSHRGLGKGALLVSAGKLLIMDDKGDVVIAEASPDEYRELAKKTILLEGVCWTTPVLCGGKLYCRNSMGDLVCLDHRSGPK